MERSYYSSIAAECIRRTAVLEQYQNSMTLSFVPLLWGTYGHEVRDRTERGNGGKALHATTDASPAIVQYVLWGVKGLMKAESSQTERASRGVNCEGRRVQAERGQPGGQTPRAELLSATVSSLIESEAVDPRHVQG